MRFIISENVMILAVDCFISDSLSSTSLRTSQVSMEEGGRTYPCGIYTFRKLFGRRGI